MAIPSHENLTRASPGITRALAHVTERLAAELHEPASKAPEFTPLEWQIARAVVAIHGIAGLLLARSSWPQVAGWRKFLETQTSATRRRYETISRLAVEIDSAAHEQNVGLIALKGLALHWLGVYEAGERPMADLDLLVESTAWRSAQELLESLGFQEVERSWKNSEFERAAAKRTFGIAELEYQTDKIDLHRHLKEKLGSEFVSMRIGGSAPARRGLSPYPSNAQFMRHLILHAAGGMASRSLRAIQLADIMRLARRLTSEEWRESTFGEWWIYPPLALVSRYFPGAIPLEVLSSSRSRCPRKLAGRADRWILTELSVSDPRLLAFPAMAWCRGIRETVSYIRSRAIPERDESRTFRALPERHAFARGQRWFLMSQPVRILMWLLRRPSRPATMYAVSQALRLKDFE